MKWLLYKNEYIYISKATTVAVESAVLVIWSVTGTSYSQLDGRWVFSTKWQSEFILEHIYSKQTVAIN